MRDWESTNFSVDRFIYVAQFKVLSKLWGWQQLKYMQKKLVLFLGFISGIKGISFLKAASLL